MLKFIELVFVVDDRFLFLVFILYLVVVKLVLLKFKEESVIQIKSEFKDKVKVVIDIDFIQKKLIMFDKYENGKLFFNLLVLIRFF